MRRYAIRLKVAGATTFVLVALSIGCAKNGVSDDTLANDIKAKLYSDAALKSANIDVGVKSGVVTLSGDVPSSDIALEAMRVANSTAGIKSVDDQLKVNPTSAMNQTPAAALPQGSSPTSNPPLDREPRKRRGESQRERDSQQGSTPAPGAPMTPVAPVASEPPKPVELTIPSGTPVSVRMIDSIDSARNQAGQVFRASLDTPLTSDGQVVFPAGSSASVLLSEARGAGRIKGQSSLEVRLASIDYHGQSYKVDSSSIDESGKGGRGKSTAVRTGIGAAAGAIIGAIAGGGKGAAIGSAAGGGAGLGVNIFTHGQQVKIPSETVLNFSLQNSLTVTPGR